MKMKKAFACLLAVLLICGIMPTGVFADETSDVETTDEPHYKVAVQLTKSETDFTNGNPYYSLEDAVYEIYKDVDDPDNYPYWEHEPCATTQATDANGYCEVPGGLPSGNYVAIMRTRATGYRYDRNHYVFGITDKDVLLTATVKPSSITMKIYKNDRDYGAAAGDATLGGAVYRVYYPQGTGETYSDITTDETGFAMVENMPFGQIRVQEITAPTGYKLDPIVHTYNITSGGNEEPFVLDNFSLRDEVIKGQIAIKTQSDIALLSLDTLDAQDRKFEVYLASAGSYNDAKETERDIVTADENGTALTKLLPYGTYTVREIGEDGEVLSEGFNVSIIEDKKTYVYTSDGEPEEKPENTATPAPTEEPTATPKPKEKVWVVDTPAREEVGHWEEDYWMGSDWVYQCNACGTQFSTVDEFESHSDYEWELGNDHGSYTMTSGEMYKHYTGEKYWVVDIPAQDEVGHWEYR